MGGGILISSFFLWSAHQRDSWCGSLLFHWEKESVRLFYHYKDWVLQSQNTVCDHCKLFKFLFPPLGGPRHSRSVDPLLEFSGMSSISLEISTTYSWTGMHCVDVFYCALPFYVQFYQCFISLCHWRVSWCHPTGRSHGHESHNQLGSPIQIRSTQVTWLLSYPEVSDSVA